MALLHSGDVTLYQCGLAYYPGPADSFLGRYIFPLAFLICFHYQIISVIWEVLVCFEVAAHQLAPNGWRILSSFSVLNLILGINLGWKEVTNLFKFQSDDESFSRVARNHNCFLVTTVPIEDESGWNNDILKLCFWRSECLIVCAPILDLPYGLSAYLYGCKHGFH